MQIADVKKFIQDAKLPEHFNVTVDNELNGTCRVVMKRKLLEPNAELTINDLVADCNPQEELFWRGWTFEADFAWEFQKALAHATVKQ